MPRVSNINSKNTVGICTINMTTVDSKKNSHANDFVQYTLHMKLYAAYCIRCFENDRYM